MPVSSRVAVRVLSLSVSVSVLPEAVERAVHFINMGIKATFGYVHNPLDGMNQEKVLHYLVEPLPYFTYELVGVFR